MVIDAVRLAKLGMDRGISGTLEGPSAYLMKSPPIQHPDEIAREMTEDYIGASPITDVAAPTSVDPARGSLLESGNGAHDSSVVRGD